MTAIDVGGWDEVGGNFADLPLGTYQITHRGLATDSSGGFMRKEKEDGSWSVATKVERTTNPAETGLVWWRLTVKNLWKLRAAASTFGVTMAQLAAAYPIPKGVMANKEAALDQDGVDRALALFDGRSGWVTVERGQNGRADVKFGVKVPADGQETVLEATPAAGDVPF